MGQIITYTGKVLDTCYFGTITLGSRVMISDPCYRLDIWCQGVLNNVLPGEYHCHTYMYDTNGWGRRVCAISVAHVDYEYEELNADEVMPFDVGVDSGQAGIFDFKYYTKHHEPFLDKKWYNDVCDLTLSIQQAGIIDDKGFVSSSGYGDGGYSCAVRRNDDGYIIGIVILFIDVDNDEEDDWEEEYV